MNYLLIFFASMIFTIFFTPYFISYLKKTRVVDLPGKRRIHADVVPRMGGLIIFLILSVMLISFSRDLNEIRLLIIAANIILLVGIFDDMLGVDYSVKFLLQTTSAVVTLFYLMPSFDTLRFFEVTIPYPLDYLLLSFFILGAINSVNLLDGMDGLVSGFSLLVFSVILALAILIGNDLLLIMVASLMGGLLGFLKYNAFPAKIFLGDTGSLTLGFFLVITSILVSIDYNARVLDLTFPLMLLAIPIVDTLRVMFSRILRGTNPFLPDQTHLHHIINKRNISHKITVFIIESLTVLFIILALYYIKVDRFIPLILFSVLAVGLFFVEPLIKVLKVSSKINTEYDLLSRFPRRYISYFERSLIGISSLFIGLIIFASFPRVAKLNTGILILLFVIGVGLFLLAYGHQRKAKDISDIYTFINLAAFFTITNLNSPLLWKMTLTNFNLSQLVQFSYYTLALIVVMFVIASEKLFPVKKVILSGIDLTVIVFILLTFIVNNFIKFHFDEYFSISFLQAFIFYLWYKVIITVKSSMTHYLFYASFALPFAALLLLLVG